MGGKKIESRPGPIAVCGFSTYEIFIPYPYERDSSAHVERSLVLLGKLSKQRELSCKYIGIWGIKPTLPRPATETQDGV